MSFIKELKRRNVVRVAIAYLALAWLLIEVAGTLLPGFGVPDWAFRFIVILLALGFVPVLIFSWAYEITPEGLKREKEVVRDESIMHLTSRRLDALTIGLIVVALVFIVVDRLWLGQRIQPQVTPATEVVQSKADELQVKPDPLPNSIAVLPFANRSANPEDVFFVDGIHDDLLTFISQIGPIKTISRTSVMKYRDSTKSIPEIARELDVATVLEGGVQRAGEQVRINVQLIDARTDDHLWSQIYDRQLTASNIFAIQSEISKSIAEALRATLTPEARDRITSVPTENLEALEAYFLGRQKMATRTVVDLAKAVGHFETAISLDPGFALANVNLAYSSSLYWNYANLVGEQRQTWLDKSQAAVKRALQLDPGLAEVHTADGLIKWYQADFENAEAAFKQALKLNPNEPQANQWLGQMLRGRAGRVEEALVYSRTAVTLDPMSAIILCDYGDVLNTAGKDDEALAHYRRAVAIEPRFSKGYSRIGDHALGVGRLDQAISAYLKAVAIEPDNWSMSRNMGALYLGIGDDQQAENWFRLALDQAPRGLAQMGTHLGRLYMYRGEKEQAMEFFHSALAGNPEDMFALYHLVNFDLAEGDFAGALARYQPTLPELFGDVPIVDGFSHVAALQLAAVYARAGEREQRNRLLDLASREVETFEPRHYEDEAVIHALHGDNKAALEALRNLPLDMKILAWREFVIGHPAFQGLLDDPNFRALDEEFEAEMARQRAHLREWEGIDKTEPEPH